MALRLILAALAVVLLFVIAWLSAVHGLVRDVINRLGNIEDGRDPHGDAHLVGEAADEYDCF